MIPAPQTRFPAAFVRRTRERGRPRPLRGFSFAGGTPALHKER
jgi:hypothetical protein